MPTFQYLGNMFGESGGCVNATSTRTTAARKGFRQLLQIITNCGISPRYRGNISAHLSFLYGCKTWPEHSETISRLKSADNGIVRWICGVRLEERIRTQEIHGKFGIIGGPEEIRWCRLRYFGQLQRMDTNVWPRNMLSQKTSKISISGRNLLMNW